MLAGVASDIGEMFGLCSIPSLIFFDIFLLKLVYCCVRNIDDRIRWIVVASKLPTAAEYTWFQKFSTFSLAFQVLSLLQCVVSIEQMSMPWTILVNLNVTGTLLRFFVVRWYFTFTTKKMKVCFHGGLPHLKSGLFPGKWGLRNLTPRKEHL